MTIQEAIKILEQDCPKRPQKLWSIKRKEAVTMAIEALQRGKQDDEPVGCYGCVHERYGNQVCDACARFYLDRYVVGEVRLKNMGEVFNRYTDTVGNYHFTDTETGHHVIPKLDNDSTKVDNENVDLIRRQDAIDCEYKVKIINDIEYVMLSEVQMKMRKLPSAQRKGKWIHGVCNNCGCNWGNYSIFADVPNYCPDCGTNMRGEEK